MGKRNTDLDSLKAFRRMIKFKYGLTPEQYEKLYLVQAGRCAICGKETKLVIDHDHATGQVRGLLCRACNLGLGHFDDTPALLDRAKTYLGRKQVLKDLSFRDNN